jgi:DNA repair protein RadC
MLIREMLETEKPRERFLKHGKEAFSNAELFAILLRTGTIGENVVDMNLR